MITVRRATHADAEAMARVQVDTWRSAYGHFMAKEYLDSLTYERSAESKHKVLDEGICSVFVAEIEGRIVGYATCGANRFPSVPCDGELQAIYVSQDYQGCGAGRSLLSACVQDLLSREHESMVVFCFSDNQQAVDFYKRLGAEFYDSGEFEIGGVMYRDSSFRWASLAQLAESLAAGKRSTPIMIG